MRAALELLADDGQMTLSALAHQFGFASHAHFVRVCRRYLGDTPRVVRESLRRAESLAAARSSMAGVSG
jgi:AraC-like DNA-binding protein